MPTSTSRNTYTVAAIPTVSPLLHVKTDNKHGSMILCSQEKAPAKFSCEIGHAGLISESVPTRPEAQKSASKYQDEAAVEECVQMHVVSRMQFLRD